MADRKRILKGLYAHAYNSCKECPYWGSGEHGSSECKTLAAQAYSLLRQEYSVEFALNILREAGWREEFGVIPEYVKPKLIDWGIYECPFCKVRVDKTYKYCKNCGRGINWDDN